MSMRLGARRALLSTTRIPTQAATIAAPTVIFAGIKDMDGTSGNGGGTPNRFTITTTAEIPAGALVQWNIGINDGCYVSSISDGLGTTYTADTYPTNPYLGVGSRTVTFVGTLGGSPLTSGSTVTFNITNGPSSTDAWVIGVYVQTGLTSDTGGKDGLTGTTNTNFTVFDNTSVPPTASGQTLMAVTTNGTGATTSVPDPPWTLVATAQSDANYGMKLYCASSTTTPFSTTATRTGGSNEWTAVWHAYK